MAEYSGCRCKVRHDDARGAQGGGRSCADEKEHTGDITAMRVIKQLMRLSIDTVKTKILKFACSVLLVITCTERGITEGRHV